MSTQLPIDIVNQICIYTGKFVLLPNGQLKSIIDIRDFEHLEPVLLSRNFFSINKLMRMWNIAELQYKEQREKEHILHLQNVDFHRHRHLFLPEEPIENMELLQNDMFCGYCIRQLSSIELYQEYEIHKKQGTIINSDNGYFIITLQEFRNGFPSKRCISCYNVIYMQTPQVLDLYEEYKKKEEKKEKIKEEIYEKKILEKKRGFSYKKKMAIKYYDQSKPIQKIRSYHMLR